MPGTAKSIFEQLGAEPVATIPDIWEPDVIKPGQTLGAPSLLFALIPASKEEEWRESYGGEEVRKQKALAAEKAAAKKAAKEREKEKKRLKKEAAAAAAAAAATQTGPSETVESAEKKQEADPAIEKVTEALEKADVHTS
jgi:methionyl-tRNA synthetase